MTNAILIEREIPIYTSEGRDLATQYTTNVGREFQDKDSPLPSANGLLGGWMSLGLETILERG